MKQLLSGQPTSRKCPKKNPTEIHIKKEPVIAKTWRKNKVATELLKYGRSPFTFLNKHFKLFNVLTYNSHADIL